MTSEDLPGFEVGDRISFITLKSVKDVKRLTKAMGHEIGSQTLFADADQHEAFASGLFGKLVSILRRVKNQLIDIQLFRSNERTSAG